MEFKAFLLFAAAELLLFGCAGTKVTRTSSDEITDLSGRWNDTDSRLTAEAMVSSMLSHTWLEDFKAEKGENPVIIVGEISNRSSEHIDSITFIKDIERELINSGQVELVAGGAAREEIRAEREDQQSHATAETAANLAAETGADFIMQGVIVTQTDAISGKRTILYKVDMELVNLVSNQKVWLGTKKMKKIVEQKRVGW